MTKDGRPSRISDIRLFHGPEGAHARNSSYLKDREEAVAFGRRIAWFLNSEDFSLGAHPSLYVLFTPALEPGVTRVTDHGGDWWQRYTEVGVSAAFPNVTNANELAMNGVIAALLAAKPDQGDLIRRADALVRKYGAKLRFLVKTYHTTSNTLTFSFSISAWRKPSLFHISNLEKSTGVYTESEPIELDFFDEGFAVARGMSIKEARMRLRANNRNSSPLGQTYDGFMLTKRVRSR